jgi:hypothetical protein
MLLGLDWLRYQVSKEATTGVLGMNLLALGEEPATVRMGYFLVVLIPLSPSRSSSRRYWPCGGASTDGIPD